MKKFKLGILGLMCCLFLTACGCGREQFVVTFDSNGGTIVESQTVEKGEKATIPVDPTKDGYTFDGWYINLDDENEFDFSTPITKNITLEAKWVQGSGNVENDKCNLTCDEGYELVNGDSKDCKCEKIEVDVSSVKLNRTSATLVVGDSITITATVKPNDANDKTVTWKSSNEKVATVKNGKVTAVGLGTATITATAGGKSSTVKITVITKDRANLNAALNKITPKTISKANTSLEYSYSGCTITNTANVVSSSNKEGTTIKNGVVKTLYRASKTGTVSSTYKVTCGSLSETKTVKHEIEASKYTYTATYSGILYIINVSGATNYTLSSENTSNLKYLEKAEGVQTPVHTPGTEYKMVLDSDANTTYAVKSAE